jgi:anti-anti-sigma regulatory factor
MALGKNIKIDKLIPSKKQEKYIEEEAQQAPSASHHVEVSNSEKELIQEEPTLISLVNDTTSNEEKPDSSSVSSDETPIPLDIIEEDIRVEFKPSKRKTQKRIIITISGDVSIKNVHILKAQIPFIFKHYNFVEIKLQDITAIDITVIQLFHIMRFTYAQEKKFTAINAELSEEHKQLLTACGFTEFHTQIKARA